MNNGSNKAYAHPYGSTVIPAGGPVLIAAPKVNFPAVEAAASEGAAAEWITVHVSPCIDNGAGICTSCQTVHAMPNLDAATTRG